MLHDLFQYLTGLQTVGGVSGTIAGLITLTLCAGYIRDPAGQVGEIGKALILALTTIIGFYFGTAAGQKMSTAEPSPTAISQPPSK
jgi:uncharacterized membrane protein YfcA